MLTVVLEGFTKDEDGRAEPLAAAAARASRDPAPLPDLLRQAQEDITKARESNHRIVFGYGHSSIAEHCVFHFHIMGLSRFMVEHLEWHRLASYTEKSQRYQRLGLEDVMCPVEYHEADIVADLALLQHEAFNLYRDMTEAGVPGEDARYVLPLCCTAQVAVTVNARGLERMLRRLRSLDIIEAGLLADGLEREARAVAPSLVRHTEASPYEAGAADRLRRLRDLLPRGEVKPFWDRSQRIGGTDGEAPVDLMHYDRLDVDFNSYNEVMVLHHMMEARGEGLTDQSMLWLVQRIYEDASCHYSPAVRDAFLDAVFGDMGPHDPAPREFEGVNLSYRVRVTASAFAQMKRHRMMTVLPMPYEPQSGYFPKAVEEWASEPNQGRRLSNLMHLSLMLMERARAKGLPMEYAALNATERDVVIHTNLRSLYAFSRLREDGHAQAEIRALATAMCDEARGVLPLLTLCLGGKDTFSGGRS